MAKSLCSFLDLCFFVSDQRDGGEEERFHLERILKLRKIKITRGINPEIFSFNKMQI